MALASGRCMQRPRVFLFALVSLVLAGAPAISAGEGQPSSASGQAAEKASRSNGWDHAGIRGAERFASAVLRRSQDGWKLRDLRVDERAGSTVLSVTMASSRAARRFRLGFSSDGNTVLGYSNRKVRVPRERRIYPVEAELMALLATSAPTMIQQECGSYFLDGFDAGLSIDPLGYHVVVKRHTGGEASSALAGILVDAVDNGLDLVAVEEAEHGAGEESGIEISFAGPTNQVVWIGTGRRGQVLSVEVRQVPFIHPWQVYTRSDELLAALRGRTAIKRVTVAATGLETDDATVVLDGQLTIDMNDFEVGDVECPC